jgi:hypothetical protein
MKQYLATGVAIVALVTAAGCGGDDGADASQDPKATTSTTGAVKPGSAQIVALDVPASAQCGGQTFTSFEVTYETSGAARAELRVDGRPIELKDPAKGTVSADVRCDPLPHDIVLFAYDEADGLTYEQALLETVG